MERQEIYEILEEQYFGATPHEVDELRGLEELVPEGLEQIIDVGASLGQYTRAFANLPGRAKVLAIEADPIRYDRLSENSVSWAQQSGTEIDVVFGAISDNSGECTFYSTESNVSGSVNAISERVSGITEIKVACFKLDDVASGTDNIFVKMDIEGGEYAAMMGAENLLRGSGNIFLLELHVWGDESRNKRVSDVLKIFLKHRYRVSRYYGHYLFRDSGRANPVRYYLIQLYYGLKRIVYYSPLKEPAMRASRWLRSVKRGNASH
jgi:FkbM family methyltransferase